MDKFVVKKKRLADETDESISNNMTKVSKPEKIVLIVAPGASGSISGAMHNDVLLRLGGEYEVI